MHGLWCVGCTVLGATYSTVQGETLWTAICLKEPEHEHPIDSLLLSVYIRYVWLFSWYLKKFVSTVDRKHRVIYTRSWLQVNLFLRNLKENVKGTSVKHYICTPSPTICSCHVKFKNKRTILITIWKNNIVLSVQHKVNKSGPVFIDWKERIPTWAILGETGADTDFCHLKGHVFHLLSHESEHASNQFGLVGARVYFQRVFTPAHL